MAEITKKELEHLAALARIDLKEGEEQKLQKDLGAILDYFKELQGVDTSNVKPMTGGTDDTGKGPEQFPDKQDGYLKVPPVF